MGIIISKLVGILIMINNQKANGDSNQQAGRDINNNIYKQLSNNPLTFYEDDIKEIITIFDGELDSIEINIDNTLDDLDRITLKEKNKLNDLSKDYFEMIIDEHYCYFYKIDDFLQDNINKQYRKMYERTVTELRTKICIRRDDYSEFERIFDDIYDTLTKDCKGFSFDRNLIWLFLSYMYYRCDIGKKV